MIFHLLIGIQLWNCPLVPEVLPECSSDGVIPMMFCFLSNDFDIVPRQATHFLEIVISPVFTPLITSIHHKTHSDIHLIVSMIISSLCSVELSLFLTCCMRFVFGHENTHHHHHRWASVFSYTTLWSWAFHFLYGPSPSFPVFSIRWGETRCSHVLF